MGRVAGTFALGAAMTVTAAAFASSSLYVPGLALMLLAVVAAAWVSAAAGGAALERRVGPATVEEGRRWPIDVRARTGPVPAPGGALVEPLLRGSVSMAGRRRRGVRAGVTFERRGRRTLEPARLVIGDPLGLIERSVEAGVGQEVLVLPRVEAVVASGRGTGSAADAVAADRPGEAAAEIEMESVRPYREGTPASRIHWPTVARAGTLMERRLLADSDSRPLVVLDSSSPADEASLDMAVRAAGSLCVHLARAGGCSVLLPGDRRAVEVGPDLGGWPAIHARLALVERAPAPAARLDARPGAVFWVTARRGLPHGLKRANGDRYLVSPGPTTGDAAFTVAGCAGVPLGRAGRRAA